MTELSSTSRAFLYTRINYPPKNRYEWLLEKFIQCYVNNMKFWAHFYDVIMIDSSEDDKSKTLLMPAWTYELDLFWRTAKSFRIFFWGSKFRGSFIHENLSILIFFQLQIELQEITNYLPTPGIACYDHDQRKAHRFTLYLFQLSSV